MKSRLERYRDLEWSAVRSDEVVPGDLYANGATVTKSRKAKASEVSYLDDASDRDLWTIRCGKGFGRTLDRDSPVVVGRRPRAAMSTNGEGRS